MAVSTMTSPFLFNIINHLICKKFNKDYHWHTVNLYSVRNFTHFILHLWLQNQRDSITSSIHPMLSTKLKPGFNLEKRVMWTMRITCVWQIPCLPHSSTITGIFHGLLWWQCCCINCIETDPEKLGMNFCGRVKSSHVIWISSPS